MTSGDVVIEIHTPKVIAVGAQLLMENRTALKGQVLDHLADGRKNIVLDFAGCEYIDSSGLGALVSIKHACTRNYATLVLAGLGADLRTLFEITKCDALFRIADRVDDRLLEMLVREQQERPR